VGVRHNGHQRAAQRSEQAAALSLQGLSQAEIAGQLGISRGRVSQLLKEVRQQWHATATRELAEHVAQQLARIDLLEREYWSAWARSQRDRGRVEDAGDEPLPQPQGTVAPRNDDGSLPEVKPGRRRHRVVREGRDGDAAFLAGIQWCIAERSKLLGLDAPKKIDITTRVRELARAAGLDENLVLAEAEAILDGTA
jgi:DNA-binding CsgD family transcriptional regulator